MAESMSSPWIRDYFMGVAETYGAQLYNAPVSDKKKKVQLTDLLTCQENSYVWAWISDKDYRVPVRISKDAADQYKSTHGRSVVDSRFFLVFVSVYRPMFSPCPLGLNGIGNTPVSHISLEIGCINSIGAGGHLFGNPRDLESDESMKEWVLGLRQDGGGGNVLKLRKQQDLAQDKKVPPSHPPFPPFPPSPVPQHQTTKAVEHVVEPLTERSPDFKRAYAKRWRKIEVDPWKFATKPSVVNQLTEARFDHPPVQPSLVTETRLESHGQSVSPTASVPHGPSPSLQRQGTPTDWSLSDRGSPPVAPDEVKTPVVGHDIQLYNESKAHIASDIEGCAVVDTMITSDARSLQPPTPAQRIKRSLIHRSSSPRHSPPGPSSCSSSRPSQQLPRSSPPPPSSSLSLPSSTLPTPMGIRQRIQRKVPLPNPPVPRPDSTKQGPVQILVPNSDTSGTGSSQSYSQSQHTSRSRQHQPQSLSHPPTLPSSLAMEFSPPEAPMPREEELVERPGSQSPMHSLFSRSLRDDRIVSSYAPTIPVGRAEDTAEEKTCPAHVPRHDPETWKNPSFIAKNKGKGKARTIEEPDTSVVQMGKKRRRSAQYESPVPKQGKVTILGTRSGPSDQTTTGIPGHMQLQDIEASATGRTCSNKRPFTSIMHTTETTTPGTILLTQPRLAKFVVDFERIDLGKRALMPRLDLENDIKSILLRTGRIRTLGEAVDGDGSVHIITR